MVIRVRRVLPSLIVASLCGTAAARAADVQVSVRSNSFTPAVATIAVGDTVTWTNSGGGIHNVRADDGSFRSGEPSSTWTYSFRFTNTGTFPYYCEVHGGPGGAGMSGRVIVQAVESAGTFSLAAQTTRVGEGAGQLLVPVARSGGAGGAVSVRLQTTAGTATAGADFGAVATTLTWGDGDAATKLVAVPIFADTATEGNETFTVELSSPTGGATLGAPRTTAVTIVDDDTVSGVCNLDDRTLCLVNGRFRVQATWVNQFDGSAGDARALPRTDLTGFFFFTDPANPELMIKILEFGDVVKVFYGQLTDLHFEITVTDVTTGAVKTYVNGPEDCGAIDQEAFRKHGIDRRALARQLRVSRARKAGTCVAGATRLCLNNKRFAVDVTWRNQFNGEEGVGGAAAFTDLAGIFSFTDPANIELMAKALDFGGGRILFLWGALSDLEYHLTLTDTTTGAVNRYDNPGGRFCGGKDTDAF